MHCLHAQEAYIRPEWAALLPLPVPALCQAVKSCVAGRQDLQLPLTMQGQSRMVPLSSLVGLNPRQVQSEPCIPCQLMICSQAL